MGRPTGYSEKMATRICELVATHEWGLEKLCNYYDDIPTKTTINLWRFKHRDFSARFNEAKRVQAELLAENCLDIADDGTNDYNEVVTKSGDVEMRLDHEHVQRSRLRIDTRKFLAAKLAPKIYGVFNESDTQSAKSLLETLLNNNAGSKKE